MKDTISAKEYQTMFKPQKRNKFNAKKVYIDGHKFDSASEGELYVELKLQQEKGLIKSFKQQWKEELWAYGKHIMNYYVDFRIEHNDGTIEFLEHKGMSTELWKKKWQMLLAKYDNEIKKGKFVCNVNWYKQKYNYKKLLKPYKPK